MPLNNNTTLIAATRKNEGPGFVLWHAKKAVYSPDAADWFWFAILPAVMFMLLGIAAAIAA